MHFLSPFILYEGLRNSLFNKIIKRNPLFSNFDYHEKVSFLFKNTDPYISRLTSAFVLC